MSNWKAAEPDHLHGFWFKKATNLDPKLKQCLQECVNAGTVPTWMTEGRTIIDIAVPGHFNTVRTENCFLKVHRYSTSVFSIIYI